MSQQPHLQSVQDSHARFEAGLDNTTDAGATPPTTPPEGGSPNRSAPKARADLALPTNRLSFENQLEVLKQVAVMSGNARRGSTAQAMSAALGLKSETGGLNSRFFRAAGWFEAVNRGEYTASAGLLDYNRHITLDPSGHFEATAGMRREVQKSWFWEAIEGMLTSGQPVQLRVLLLTLSKVANANDHGIQLETIIDWLVWVGLLTREEDTVKLAVQPAHEPEVEPDAERQVDQTGDVDEPHREEKVEDQENTPALAKRAEVADPEAMVSFNLSVRITADDMKTMTDEQMAFLMNFAEKLRG